MSTKMAAVQDRLWGAFRAARDADAAAAVPGIAVAAGYPPECLSTLEAAVEKVVLSPPCKCTTLLPADMASHAGKCQLSSSACLIGSDR